MHREAPTERLNEVLVFERMKIVTREAQKTRLRDHFDLAPFLGRREEKSVTSTLVNSVVARRPRKDEHDHREQIIAFERLEELTSPR
jgi:hypothetical protein